MSQVQSEGTEELDQPKEKIRGGESTGDPITDFVILTYSGNKEIENNIRILRDSLKNNEGGLVALEEHYTHLMGESGCHGGRFTRQKSIIYLGRLKEPFLKLGKEEQPWQRILLGQFCDAEIVVDPLAKIIGDVYGDWRAPIITEEPKIEHDKNIDFVLTAYLWEGIPPLNMGKKLGPISVGGFHTEAEENRLEAYNLYVGTEEVDKLFQKMNPTLRYDKEDRFNVKRQFYPTLKKLLTDEKTLVSYFEERQRREEENRVAKVDDLTIKLIESTYEVVRATRKLEKRIKEIPGNARRSMEAVTFPGEVTARDEVETDFKEIMQIASYGERQKLKELRGKVSRQLQEGLKLDMHQEQREITVSYLPGARINIAGLVTGLCEQYKVEIPKEEK